MSDLYLIDANSIIHRCFHALPPLTTPLGRPSQALYGIANILLKIIAADKPRYAAALFDRPEPTFRKAISAEYKANRPKAPDELVSQIIAAHDIFPAFGIPVFELPGYEADDLIAEFAKRFGGNPSADGSPTGEVRAVILTGDLDTLQLVKDGKIVVRVFRKGISETDLYDEAAVMARYGLRPDQLADYKSFVGDQSDNVKGLPGIGPKTAVALLSKYGTIDGIYAHLKDEPSNLAERLAAGRTALNEARSLVVLSGEVPLPEVPLQDLAVTFDEDQVRDYCAAMGFRSLAARIGAPPKSEAVKTKTKREPKQKPAASQGSMF
ncbi:MAG: 5'-3' exonuclease H3TH domain-containing protein [Patescibacteria group bacterium]